MQGCGWRDTHRKTRTGGAWYACSVPFVTDALRKHISFAVKQQPDYLAISFVSSADDVTSLNHTA